MIRIVSTDRFSNDLVVLRGHLEELCAVFFGRQTFEARPETTRSVGQPGRDIHQEVPDQIPTILMVGCHAPGYPVCILFEVFTVHVTKCGMAVPILDFLYPDLHYIGHASVEQELVRPGS